MGTHGWTSGNPGSWPEEQVFMARESLTSCITYAYTHTYTQYTHQTHTHTLIHIYTHAYTHTQTYTCIYTHTLTHLHVCVGTCTRHTHTHILTQHTGAHLCAHTYTCTHNTPTTLQYKYLAEANRAVWSKSLKLFPSSLQRAWLNHTIYKISFHCKILWFRWDKTHYSPEACPGPFAVLLTGTPQAGVTAFGAWPGHPHQASAARVTGIRVRSQGSLYCRYLWSFFLVPPPHSHTLLWFFWSKNCLVNKSHGQPSEAGRFSQD